MKRKLIFISIFAVLLAAIYSAGWVAVTWSVCQKLNKEYAGKPLGFTLEGIDYSLQFTKAEPTGFPFRIAIKVIGLNEDNKYSRVDYIDPIVIGYNLLTQNIVINNASNVIAKYKPLPGGFGVKIHNDDYSLVAKLPLSFELIRILAIKKNPIEAVNFIKYIELNSANLKVFDLIDNTLLHDGDYQFLRIDIGDHPYYTKVEDLLNNIPNKLDIKYSGRVKSSTIEKKIIPNNLFYGVVLPFTFSCDVKMVLTSSTNDLKNPTNDFNINVKSLKFTSRFVDTSTELLYKTRQNKVNKDSVLDVKGKISIKKGFFDGLSDFLETVTLRTPKAMDKQIKDYTDEIKYYLKNKTIYGLQEIEDADYEYNLASAFAFLPGGLHIKIDDFSMHSGNTGINFKNETNYDNQKNRYRKWDTKGVVALNNYPKLVDFLVTYGYFLRFVKGFDGGEGFYKKYQNLAGDTVGFLLKTVSEYPNSSSNDVKFNFILESDRLDRAQIGKFKIADLKNIYYAILLKNANSLGIDIEKELKGNIGKEIKKNLPPKMQEQGKAIKKLLPKDAQDILKQLIK